MENEYTCARCGKPCPEGEFMCEECSAWLEGHAGTEEVSGFELEEIIRGKEPQEEPAPIPAAMPAMMPAEEPAAEQEEAAAETAAEEAAAEEAAAETKRCIHCDGTIPAAAEFCPLCGKDLLAEYEEDGEDEYEEYEEEDEEEEYRRAPVGLIIGLCVTILLLVGALIAMIMLVMQERPAPAPQQPSDTGLGMFEPAEGIPTPEELEQEAAEQEPEPEIVPEAVACRSCGVAITVEDAICPFCEWDQALDPADFVDIPLEVTLTFGEGLEDYALLPVSSTSETSFLKQTTHDNTAALTVDGDLATSWQEGVYGSYGIGESVNYEFEEEVYVKGMALWLGNWREGGSWYEENGVPKMVNIYIGEDKVLTVEFPYAKQVHYVEFNQLVPTKLIMLEISSVYEGSIYTDTCIAEVEIYGSTEAE